MTDYSVANLNKEDGGPAEKNFPFAGLLEKKELRYLGSLMERHCAKRGECLWRQGDMDERLGLIVRGRVKILKETSTPNNPLIVGVFGPGALLIDLGFVEGPPGRLPPMRSRMSRSAICRAPNSQEFWPNGHCWGTASSVKFSLHLESGCDTPTAAWLLFSESSSGVSPHE